MSESTGSLPASAHNSAKKALCDRLVETMANTAQEPDIRATADMLHELLLIVHRAQVEYGRPRASVRMKHRVLHAPNTDTLSLEISNIDVLGTPELDALRRFAGQCYGSTRFEFRSPTTDELLSCGRIVMRLGTRSTPRANENHTQFVERCAPSSAAIVAHYAPPDTRRAQTMQIDWSASVVADVDRALVLELIDDIYNMHQLMPTNMTVSLEPIERTDHQTTARTKRKTRAADNDDGEATSAESDSALRAPCVGYALHFVNVPSFSDNFLAHLTHKFASRWLGATVLFPHQRRFKRSGVLQIAPQIIVSLRAEGASAQTKAFQLRGAKRACKKIEAVVN